MKFCNFSVSCNILTGFMQIRAFCFAVLFLFCSNVSVFATGIESGTINPMCYVNTFGSYTGPMALQAEYDVNTYTITYYGNSNCVTTLTGANYTPTTYTVEDNISLPQLPKTGYTFQGWKKCNSQVGSINSWSSGTYTEDMALYPSWEADTYTVTYSCGSLGGTAPSTNTSATYGESFTPDANTCTLPVGSNFTGWLVSGTNDVVSAGVAFTWEYTQNKTFTAQYEVNGIDLHWFDNNAEMTVASAAQSCVYGDDLTVAANPPARTGNVFMGWELCSLTGFNASESIQLVGYITNNGATVSSANGFGLTQNQTWAIRSASVTIWGEARCSAKVGNTHSRAWGGNSSDWSATDSELNAAGNGGYCWCKPLRYKPADGEICYVTAPMWVVANYPFGGYEQCEMNCARTCTTSISNYTAFRSALYYGQ